MNFKFLNKTPVWALLLLIVSGCQALTEDQARQYETGLEAARLEHWDEAESFFDGLVGEKPNFELGVLERGISRFHLERFEEAITDLIESLETHRLAPENSQRGLYILARSRIELALKNHDPELRSPELVEATQAALLELQHARAIGENYDILAWEAYCQLIQQGYDAALRQSEACTLLNPDRPEHQLVRALTLEAIETTDQIPEDSLAIYKKLVEQDSNREYKLLYNHVSNILDRLSEDDVEFFLQAIEEHVQNGSPFEGTEARAQHMRHEIEERKVQEAIQAALTEAAALQSEGNFESAQTLLLQSQETWPEEPDFNEQLTHLRASWIQSLEEEAETALNTRRLLDLRRGIEQLTQAIELSTSSSQSARLQLKIDSYRVALARFPRVQGFSEIQKLVLAGNHEEALRKIQQLSADNISKLRRDTFHFLKGWLHYHHSEWKEALTEFEKLPEGTSFMNLNLAHGVSLWHENRSKDAFEFLKEIPQDARTDEVRRILGHEYIRQGDQKLALENLERLRQPTKEDDQAFVNILKNEAERSRVAEDWEAALQYWLQARRIVESRLFSSDATLYVSIAQAYSELGEVAPAKKVLEDLKTLDTSGFSPESSQQVYQLHAELHLKEKEYGKALEAFNKFQEVGGVIPEEQRDIYLKVLSLEQDFFPLDKVKSWEYELRGTNERLRFEIVERTPDNKVKVERTQNLDRQTEIWEKAENNWIRIVDKAVYTIPVGLSSIEEEFPRRDQWFKDVLHRWELISIGQMVEPTEGVVYSDCILVRNTVRTPTPEGLYDEAVTDHYFAPGIGEVLQRSFFNEKKLKESYLVHVEFRAEESESSPTVDSNEEVNESE